MSFVIYWMVLFQSLWQVLRCHLSYTGQFCFKAYGRSLDLICHILDSFVSKLMVGPQMSFVICWIVLFQSLWQVLRCHLLYWIVSFQSLQQVLRCCYMLDSFVPKLMVGPQMSFVIYWIVSFQSLWQVLRCHLLYFGQFHFKAYSRSLYVICHILDSFVSKLMVCPQMSFVIYRIVLFQSLWQVLRFHLLYTGQFCFKAYSRSLDVICHILDSFVSKLMVGPQMSFVIFRVVSFQSLQQALRCYLSYTGQFCFKAYSRSLDVICHILDSFVSKLMVGPQMSFVIFRVVSFQSLQQALRCYLSYTGQFCFKAYGRSLDFICYILDSFVSKLIVGPQMLFVICWIVSFQSLWEVLRCHLSYTGQFCFKAYGRSLDFICYILDSFVSKLIVGPQMLFVICWIVSFQSLWQVLRCHLSYTGQFCFKAYGRSLDFICYILDSFVSKLMVGPQISFVIYWIVLFQSLWQVLRCSFVIYWIVLFQSLQQVLRCYLLYAGQFRSKAYGRSFDVICYMLDSFVSKLMVSLQMFFFSYYH